MIFVSSAFILVNLTIASDGHLFILKHPDVYRLFNPARHRGNHYLSKSPRFKYELCKDSIQLPSFTTEDQQPMSFSASKEAEKKLYKAIYRLYHSLRNPPRMVSLRNTSLADGKVISVVMCSNGGKYGMLLITERDDTDSRYFLIIKKKNKLINFNLNAVPDVQGNSILPVDETVALVEESAVLTDIPGTSIENKYLAVEDMFMASLQTPTDFNFCDSDDITKHRICCSTYSFWNPNVWESKWKMRTFTVNKITCVNNATVMFSEDSSKQPTLINNLLECLLKLPPETGVTETYYVTADSSSIENAYILQLPENKQGFHVIRHMTKLNAYKEYVAIKENHSEDKKGDIDNIINFQV